MSNDRLLRLELVLTQEFREMAARAAASKGSPDAS